MLTQFDVTFSCCRGPSLSVNLHGQQPESTKVREKIQGKPTLQKIANAVNEMGEEDGFNGCYCNICGEVLTNGDVEVETVAHGSKSVRV